MPRGTTLRNVRIDGERWDAFAAAVAADSLDRSTAIRALIDGYVAGEFVLVVGHATTPDSRQSEQ